MDIIFNDYLSVHIDGRFHMDGLDLAQPIPWRGQGQSPLGKADAQPTGDRLLADHPPPDRAPCGEIFAEVRAELGYPGQFHYAYASKANAAEEVIRTTLATGAHHEMSSTVDVEIARLDGRAGPVDRPIATSSAMGSNRPAPNTPTISSA